MQNKIQNIRVNNLVDLLQIMKIIWNFATKLTNKCPNFNACLIEASLKLVY